MSNRQEDEGPRDNTSPEHKPENTANSSKAPKGSIGRQNSHPSLNLGGAQNREFTFVLEADEPHESAQTTRDPEDTRPIAITSGDKEVDAQSQADGFQLKTQDEIDQLSGVDPSGETVKPDQAHAAFDDMMQDDGATHFQRTDDPQVNQHYEDRGETPVNSDIDDHGLEAGAIDNPFGAKGDLEKAFNRVKGHEIARGQSKGPEPS